MLTVDLRIMMLNVEMAKGAQSSRVVLTRMLLTVDPKFLDSGVSGTHTLCLSVIYMCCPASL